jgi:hypothetical protein
MSRPSYLRGQSAVPIPEPPSIAARRRNSNATSLQLQPAIADSKARAYGHGAPYQTPSPKQTYSAGKNADYFRVSHTGAGGQSGGATSPSVNLAHQRHRSNIYGQPPTPSITQHVPAWNLREEPRSRGGSISGPELPAATDDPLHILDTLPIQNMRLNANASASDSRCGTLKRPAQVTEERRTTTWPSAVVLDASTSGIANRRLANAAEQSRPITAKVRSVEPVANTTRPPQLSNLSRSPSQLNRPPAADCFI